MTLKQLIHKLKMYKPQTIKEFRKFIPFVKTRIIASGAFRTAYSVELERPIAKNPLFLEKYLVAIKFPDEHNDSDSSLEECIDHSRAEIVALERVLKLKALKPLRRYLPTVHYYDLKTGVIVMDKYRVSKNYILGYEFGQFLDSLFADLSPKYSEDESDFHFNNIGVDEFGKFKILDLGLVSV